MFCVEDCTTSTGSHTNHTHPIYKCFCDFKERGNYRSPARQRFAVNWAPRPFMTVRGVGFFFLVVQQPSSASILRGAGKRDQGNHTTDGEHSAKPRCLAHMLVSVCWILAATCFVSQGEAENQGAAVSRTTQDKFLAHMNRVLAIPGASLAFGGKVGTNATARVNLGGYSGISINLP